MDGRDEAAVFEAAFQRVRTAAKGSVELAPNLAHADLGIAGGSPILEVGGREEASHGLHTTAFAIHRILGLGVAVAALGSHGE